MSKIQDFLDQNKPTRMYHIIKRLRIRMFGYSLEVRILKEDGHV